MLGIEINIYEVTTDGTYISVGFSKNDYCVRLVHFKDPSKETKIVYSIYSDHGDYDWKSTFDTDIFQLRYHKKYNPPEWISKCINDKNIVHKILTDVEKIRGINENKWFKMRESN